MKKVLCKRNYQVFKVGEYYQISSLYSVFDKDDFISILSKNNQSIYRFRMNKSQEYVEDYIGWNENYFYDYFCDLKEERKLKLENLSKKITS